MSEFENVTAPPPPPSGTAPQEDRTIALLTHLSGILFGFIVPLVIWLVNKDRSDKGWLNDQAIEALNFQITLFIAVVVSWVLMFVLIGFLLLPLLVIANLVFCIIAGMKANSGEAYRYPFALRLIK